MLSASTSSDDIIGESTSRTTMSNIHAHSHLHQHHLQQQQAQQSQQQQPAQQQQQQQSQQPAQQQQQAQQSLTECSILSDSDDEDDDYKVCNSSSGNATSSSSSHCAYNANASYKERRREAHTQAEQKRRDAIKKGYGDLQLLVPSCTHQDTISSYKLSKAAILQRSIDYMQSLQAAKHKRERELQLLRKEVLALDIVRTNYEQMVRQNQKSQQQSQPLLQQVQSSSASASSASALSSSPAASAAAASSETISSDTKFELYKAICDTLFRSFDASVRVNSFSELSACTIAWLEEHCKPHNLHAMICSILEQANNGAESWRAQRADPSGGQDTIPAASTTTLTAGPPLHYSKPSNHRL